MTRERSLRLICPTCREDINKNDSFYTCPSCNKQFEKRFGVVYFSDRDLEEEQSFYDQDYHKTDCETYTTEKAERFWFDEFTPDNHLLYKQLQPLEDQRILLLGNGSSINEFYFVEQGAKIVFTDLSPAGVCQARQTFQKHIKQYSSKAKFFAVHGIKTPFSSCSFDRIYGYEFVHHLRDKAPLMNECYRLLKDDGKAVFRDVSYSPFWEISKHTILKPLQKYSHWKTGISPADLRATREGGFRENQVRNWLD